MNKDLKKLSINDIKEVSTDNSDEFFYAKICVLSTRPNSHKVLITEDILKRDGETIRGKWIVADPKYGETMSHTSTEFIVGIVPENTNIEYIKDDDGYICMYVDAVLSKIYGKQVYDMFKTYNKRNVSVEMMTMDLEKDEFGNIPIESLKICGVTILGKLVNGSCPDANITITKFSQEKAEKSYKKFAENNFEQVLNKDNNEKEKKMEDKKEFESTPNKEKEEDIVMEEKEKTSETQPLNNSEEEKEMKEKECSEENKVEENKEMSEEKTEENKEISEEEQKDEKDFSEDDEKDDDDKVDDKDDKDEEEKEDKAFALKEFVTVSFEEETDEVKEYVQEKVYSMSADEIVNELVSLKKFEIAQNVKEKEFQLGQIMANVKGDLDEKTFSELKEEGLKLSLNELGGFENKVKAFAYESTKKNKKEETEDGIMKFGGSEKKKEDNVSFSAEDIFDKYLRG